MSSGAIQLVQEAASPYLPYRRALLSSAQIKELSTPKPWRAIVDAVICWAWIVAAMSLVAMRTSWWTVPIAIPVIGNRYYALFIIAHDGMHRRLFPTIKRNDFWTDVLALGAIGAITHINNRNHLTHHRHLATLEIRIATSTRVSIRPTARNFWHSYQGSLASGVPRKRFSSRADEKKFRIPKRVQGPTVTLFKIS